MKILYIAKSIIPSQSANSIHVMKICEAFSELKNDITLLVPQIKKNYSQKEIIEFYGIEHKFKILRINQFKIKPWFDKYIFAVLCTFKFLKLKTDKIVTRDPLVALLAVIFHKQVVLDLHGEIAHLCGRAYRMIKWNFFINSKYLHLTMITDSLADFYRKKYNLDSKLVTVLPDGCTLKNFSEIANNPLFNNQELKLAYVGSLGIGRGLEIINDLASADHNNQYNVYGGTLDDAKLVLKNEPSSNIIFHGFVPNKDIPGLLCTNDILLLPYQKTLIAKGEDTGKVMSPLKMFEYMASGRIIISSDLPVLKEVLTDENCFFAISDQVNSWRQTIQYIETNKDEAIKKAARAKEDVIQYTWKIRAQKIMKLLT